MPQKKKETASEPDAKNSVFIGKKPTMSYVFAVQTQAQVNKEVHIRARGRSISKAVDVSQIVLDRFLNGWILEEINVGTEEKKPEDSVETEMDRVSYIDMVIKAK